MGAIRCVCGAALVEDITETGVRPVGGKAVIPLRRTTDYILCEACLRTYTLAALLEQALKDEASEPEPQPTADPPVA